jgi:iron complex outermembrane recepter protein
MGSGGVASRIHRRSSEHVPFLRNRDVLSIQSLAHVLVGEPASTRDQVRGRLSPGHALGVALAAIIGATALTLGPAVAQQSGAPVALPTVEVVGNAPLPGSEIDRSKIPSNIQTIDASAFDHAKSPSLTDAMVRALPGVSLGNQTGNPFQPDVNYRGFTVSPVIGTSQGLAVYQNGTRINEVFGDTVNWDFIPEGAIRQMTLAPNNPVYGLNALGGAITIEMKNGFTYQGVEGEARMGSYGRMAGAAQAGVQNGNLAAYVAFDGVDDDGWRDFSSASRLRRMYFDFGARSEQTEFHVSLTGADNKLGGVVATPVEMLNQRWSSVYTWPQESHNKLAFLQASGSYKPSDTFSLQSNIYYRGFWQSHIDGNTTNAQPCTAPGLLCFGNDTTPLLDLAGNQVLDVFGPNLGEIDRTWTTANSFGGSLQATDTAQLLGHDNHLVVGASVDHGLVQFTGNSELGTIDQDLFVTGTGVLIQQPAGDLAPVGLRSRTNYTGVYATDTFDITSRLSLTAGGRFNVARIRLEDEFGTALNGDHTYSRFNPVVGLTYKIMPDLTAYAGYSEANRAPTPLELGCADPSHPCLIDGFLISDPSLKQVVGHTYEAGLRGSAGDKQDVLKWNLGVYRTDSDDDIINVPSLVSGFGYFQNAAKTRRQGVEAGVIYKRERWSAYANYTFVDATFQSALTLSSPFNPAADTNGNISVVPGDQIPAVPRHRFKAGAEYSITEPWTIGIDLDVIGSQYLVADQSNQNPKVPAYWVVNAHSSYKLTKNVEVFALVQNLFNQHYYVAGTFFNTQAIPFLNLTDPRTFIPGMPLAAYAGVRATF